MTNFYQRHLLPRLIDALCGMPVCQRARKKVIAEARGRVLEIGIGTGRNLPFYKRDQIESLCGIDPFVHPKAASRAQEANIDISLRPLKAENIPADDNSFDCVICTFTLCTIDDTATALGEVKRVLAPGGKLIFLEHGAAPDATVRELQNKLNSMWGKVAGGCCLNKDVPALIENGGFTIKQLDSGYKSGPRFLTYFYSGIAMN